MIDRLRHMARCLHLLDSVPCVAILGARQVGKTTLAKALTESWGPDVDLFDLERPSDLIRLEDPEVALGSLNGLVGSLVRSQQPTTQPASIADSISCARSSVGICLHWGWTLPR